MLRALVVRALADLLGLGRELDAQARAGLRTAFGMLGELQRLLMNAGALKATIDALLATLARTVDRLLPDEVAQLRTALLSAREGIRRQLDPMVLALDRAFFRETLIPGASLADLEIVAPSAPPPAASGNVRDLRELFGALRLSPQLSSLIAQYESKRVSTLPLLGQRQELTHVLSLLDVLGITSATGVVGAPAERLQTLLRDTPLAGGTTLPAAGLAFTLAPALLDRVAPGLHSQLIKDVAVQIDFEPVANEAAFAALAQQLGEAAGGTLDPALASRATGFSLPGLPIAPLRFPTGVPAVLEQSCGSSVRVPPAVAAMYNGCTIGGPCNTPLPADQRPPSLVNVELGNDPNTGAQAAGYRMMTFRDGPVRLMFSHFELTRDSLRFIAEPKQLKPFEHRGVFGAWKLEVPAVVRKFITHDLPKIRDVRLMISTSGQWDGTLRDALSAPPAAATLHTAPTVLPATLDELLKTVKSLLDAANLGNLLQLEALLGVPLPVAPGNLVVPTLLPHTQLTNGTAVLGGAVGKWPVTGVRYVDGTPVPTNKIVAVRSVRAALTSSVPLMTATTTGVQGVVAFTPTGGQRRQANADLADGVEDVPASALGSPASPIGEWEIDMPAGLPLTALALTIFTEVAP